MPVNCLGGEQFDRTPRLRQIAKGRLMLVMGSNSIRGGGVSRVLRPVQRHRPLAGSDAEGGIRVSLHPVLTWFGQIDRSRATG